MSPEFKKPSENRFESVSRRLIPPELTEEFEEILKLLRDPAAAERRGRFNPALMEGLVQRCKDLPTPDEVLEEARRILGGEESNEQP